MPKPILLHEDRLFPADPIQRGFARALYAEVRDLPIISPHGHTDPSWFADNEAFPNATELLLAPFKDDVVVRVRPDGNGSRIDVRSVSRVGGSDVGANAARIRSYLRRLRG
jgi:glucuronate isomerase